ncbi:hypothetical protein MNBD_ALPHA03-381 [hydrothermal vent metagenome]|uniref:Uncharacterized protein n=1 Tax=hydrothermal vent metagenome TaxID=652676 RepID=A0A3B1BKL7_9ZZZZ
MAFQEIIKVTDDMQSFTTITILTGIIFLSTLCMTKAQETNLILNDVAQDDDGDGDDTDMILDDIDMILRDYHVIILENQSEVSLHVGFDYTQGDYGNLTNTKMIYMPISLNYTVEAWRFRVSSGYISVMGEENIIPGIGFATLLTDPSVGDIGQGNDNGIGDIFLSTTYAFNELRADNLYFDITAQIKIPTTGVAKGLSTGKTDFSLQFGMTKIIGNFLPFATFGYRYVGKTEYYDLQNIWFASLGMAYYLNRDITLGLSYDLRKSVNVNTTNLQEIQVYMDYRFPESWGTENWGAYFYGITGLSDNSPDIGGGFQLKYYF